MWQMTLHQIGENKHGTYPMLQPGTILQNRYTIIKPLGKGGFGTVYQALDQRLDNHVAIKETVQSDPDVLRQFEREAQILARLDHPALPGVIDYFSEHGVYYLVMAYIPGEDLEDLLARQPDKRISEKKALEIVYPVLDALHYLHTQQPPIIHRDIKPGNIRIRPDGTIFLVDFGQAKVYDPNKKTAIGAQGLTPGFAPLEQYGGSSTDARTDLYALGATLYVMLSGLEDFPQAPSRMMGDTLQPLRQFNSAVSPEMEQCVTQLLEMKPEDRYQDVVSLRHDLDLLRHLPATGATTQALPSTQPQPQLQPHLKQSQPQPPTPSPAGKKQSGVLPIVLVLVVLVVLGGAGYWFANRSGLFGPQQTPVVSSSTNTPVSSPTPIPSPSLVPTATQVQPTASPAGTTATASPEPTPNSTPSPAPINTAPLPGTLTERIAFVSDRDGNEAVYVMDATGDAVSRLTRNRVGVKDQFPAWSPDGSLIAFQSDRDGNAEIYVMRADGSEQVNLTNDPARDEKPAWSPDGTQIVFSSYRDANTDIYVVNADGSGEPVRLTEDAGYDVDPSWSPDGRQIAFVSRRNNQIDLYVMQSDGTLQQPLTDDQALEKEPSWSPDGSHIAFVSDGNVYIMNVDGSSRTLLFSGERSSESPTWSPDGAFLAFSSGGDVYVIRSDGTDQKIVTGPEGDDTFPAWSP